MFLLLIFSLQSFAQRSNQTNTATKVNAEISNTQDEISNALKACPDLDKQLITLFGNDYTIQTPGVKSQLEKNIADKNMNRCIRKNSLKAFYGKDYINKLYLIDQTN